MYTVSKYINCILNKAEKQEEMRGLPSISQLFHAEHKIESIFEALFMYQFILQMFNLL